MIPSSEINEDLKSLESCLSDLNSWHASIEANVATVKAHHQKTRTISKYDQIEIPFPTSLKDPISKSIRNRNKQETPALNIPNLEKEIESLTGPTASSTDLDYALALHATLLALLYIKHQTATLPVIKCILSLSCLYSRRSMHPQALEHASNALQYLKLLDLPKSDKEGQKLKFKIHCQIAIAYCEMKRIKETKEHVRSADVLMSTFDGDEGSTILFLKVKARLAELEGNTQEAIESYEKVTQLLGTKDPLDNAQLLIKISQLQAQFDKNNDRSITSLRKADGLLENVNHEHHSLQRLLVKLKLVETYKGHSLSNSEATKIALEALKIQSRSDETLKLIQQIRTHLVQLHIQESRYGEALYEIRILKDQALMIHGSESMKFASLQLIHVKILFKMGKEDIAKRLLKRVLLNKRLRFHLKIPAFVHNVVQVLELLVLADVKQLLKEFKDLQIAVGDQFNSKPSKITSSK